MSRIYIGIILTLSVSLSFLLPTYGVAYKRNILIQQVDFGGGGRTGVSANIMAKVTVENVSNQSRTFNVTLLWDQKPVDWKTVVNLAPNATVTVFVSAVVDDPPTGHSIGVMAGDASLFAIADRPADHGLPPPLNWLAVISASVLNWLVGSLLGVAILLLLLNLASLLIFRRKSSHVKPE